MCIISVYAEHRECVSSGLALHNCKGYRVTASGGEPPFDSHCTTNPSYVPMIKQI